MTKSLSPPTSSDTDLMLVERTVAGDHKAFELLVLKYQRRIERLIGRMVRDTDLIEDIAQETFIRAYRALAQFRGEAQFYTWLYRIAVNTAKKALVDMKRDPTVSETALRGASGDEEDETSGVQNELTSSETPETVLAAKEIAAAVNAAMEALPEELRQAVTLREIEGLSYEEIAEVMNCPIGTVRSRIFRARDAISTKVRPMLENQTGKRW
ncbi:RNA polymerase sigma factor RpoE [Caenimonas koreensis]|uniref:RNA polymerase sigma factor RpoE n=1 Tax=Caenimonas koreensis TaxID=367474 RepID=UPI003784281E